MQYRAIKTSDNDNVAIATIFIPQKARFVSEGKYIMANHDIPIGHKVALKTLKKGGAVIRYGETIAQATENIEVGDWVHVHNTTLPPSYYEL